MKALGIALLFSTLFFFGCNENNQEKPQYLYDEDFIHSIDNETFIKDTDTKITYFDSLLVNAENLTRRDIYEIYNIKINYSLNHYHNYKLALLQLDTAENLAI